jgi:hypothetical protein
MGAAHEFERPPAVTRRPPEAERRAEPDPPAAVLDLQRLAGNESVGALLGQERSESEESDRSPVREVVGSGGGSPLDPGARSFLEGRMGADFSDVRVHTGPAADESARSIGAQAYTVGTDVVFGGGAYQPDSPSGRHVLAHELAHVIQQKAGPVEGTPIGGGVSVSHPSDRFEQAAAQAADRAMAGDAGDPTAQRVEAGHEEDEEEVRPA